MAVYIGMISILKSIDFLLENHIQFNNYVLHFLKEKGSNDL
jgi:hypothetical protein